MRDFDFATRADICKLLNLRDEVGQNDYRKFADAVGMSNVEIKALSKKQPDGSLADPTDSILTWWEKKREATVDKMKDIMRQMGRDDVCEILNEYYRAISCT